MNEDKTIKRLRRKIAGWRQSKSGKTSQVPGKLRKEIIDACSQYPVGKLAHKLDISSSMIARWINSNTSKAKTRTKSKIDFIEVFPKAFEEKKDELKPRVIELFRRDGLQLRICGDFSDTSLIAATASLLSEIQKQ